eukprot:m.33173 g.33173  ORF g.33173 m.33173 type:complete len:58 (+) comp6436_c3_seq2:592-765(+)
MSSEHNQSTCHTRARIIRLGANPLNSSILLTSSGASCTSFILVDMVDSSITCSRSAL